LTELREVEELEKIVFGEMSVNVAKTLKVIGTLLSVSGSREQAKNYLIQAHQIF
jgi:hypothetical protein